MFSEKALHGLSIIPLRDKNVLMWTLTAASTNRRTHSGGDLCRGRVIAHQHAVVPPMVVSFELEETGTACVCACKSQGDLHDLCAAVGEAYQVGAWYDFRKLLGDLELKVMLGAEGKASAHLSRDRLRNLRWGVSKNERAPC